MRTFVRVIVAHLDLDAFYAAVEELENPDLRAQPLVVGGDPRGRGVVATANYVARGSGIHSAMRAAEALRRCPQAVFVRPRHALYREHSQHVWETVRGIVPTVEQTGMDEGYLDVGEVAGDFLAARVVAEAVQTAVRAATRLTCALGVAPCNVVAKVASDARKRGEPGRRSSGTRTARSAAAPLRCARESMRLRRSATWLAASSTAACATGRARCDSSASASPASPTSASSRWKPCSSRGGGTRTPDLRFWRPPLYQLSYAPVPVGQCTRPLFGPIGRRPNRSRPGSGSTLGACSATR